MDPTRISMPGRWLAADDVDVSMASDRPRVGRRLSMDVDELMLAQIGARGLEACVDTLGRTIALEHRGAIESAIVTALADPQWVRRILEDEFRRAARAMLMTLWSDEEKKNLRDWFDLLTAMQREPHQDTSAILPSKK